jgi:hypothetical protein
MSRIDRVWFHWIEEYYPNVTQKLLLRPISDHHPILLEMGGYGEREVFI